MDTDINSIIREELNQGERILWSDRPQQGFMLHRSDIAMIPVSLMFCGLATFISLTMVTESPLSVTLWSLLFVLLAAYMLVGRFFVEAMQRGRTYYALTNERVLIIFGLFGRKVKSLDLKTIYLMDINVNSDGRGTITFGPLNFKPWWAYQRSERYEQPALEGIKNARHVYNLIRKAQRHT
jgi:hypothetical protein